MDISPNKRVGSPASLKGVRGEYLTTLIMYAAGSLFLVLIIMMIPIFLLLQIGLIALVLSVFIYKYIDLKKNSKGDIYSVTKKNSRKKILIKSTPLKINHGKK